MLIQSASLAATTAGEARLDILAYINELCERINAAEQQIQALLPEPDRRERLQNEAKALEARYPPGTTRPPLFGIPIGVKDMFNVDGFVTRAGSQLPAEVFHGPEAACVTALRRAGALILGKTVSTEFAYFEPGPTRNPHNLAHTPGGSSSGSAAAVAAGFCPLALGTQTIGSTIRPAAFCGIVGFKPSYGRVSTIGLVPCAPSVDTAGCFAQDVASIALVAPLLCAGWQPVEVGKALPILGVPEGPYLEQASPEGLAAFQSQLSQLEQVGYKVKRIKAFSDIEAINRRHIRLVFAEMAQVHADWFKRYEALYRPRTAEAIREGQTVSEDELRTARYGRAMLRAKLAVLMEQHGFDIWLAPSAPGPAPEGIQSTGNALLNLPWTHAGLPAISLPASKAANGLPLGLQCIGNFMADEKLLQWVGSISQVFAESSET